MFSPVATEVPPNFITIFFMSPPSREHFIS
jgi:hypothetical protein